MGRKSLGKQARGLYYLWARLAQSLCAVPHNAPLHNAWTMSLSAHAHNLYCT